MYSKVLDKMQIITGINEQFTTWAGTMQVRKNTAFTITCTKISHEAPYRQYWCNPCLPTVQCNTAYTNKTTKKHMLVHTSVYSQILTKTCICSLMVLKLLRQN